MGNCVTCVFSVDSKTSYKSWSLGYPRVNFKNYNRLAERVVKREEHGTLVVIVPMVCVVWSNIFSRPESLALYMALA